MSYFSTTQPIGRGARRHRRSLMTPLIAAGTLAFAAIALVAYLLWPTWRTQSVSDPERLPVSVGATLFNVPPQAIRMKIQRHSGPQERIDLYFDFPSLAVPEGPKHVSADTVEDAAMQPIDRIFLSISAHHDAMGPDVRLNTIYPRYLDPGPTAPQAGWTRPAFRDGSPYGNEDLVQADSPALVARCSRDGATPGMCLSERRIGGADLTFRFPRRWLTQWRDVAGAIDRLTLDLHGPK